MTLRPPQATGSTRYCKLFKRHAVQMALSKRSVRAGHLLMPPQPNSERKKRGPTFRQELEAQQEGSYLSQSCPIIYY